MAEILLLPEQQFTSVYLEGTGWCWDIPATFDLVPGQSYRIVFDGTDYECVCMDISAMFPNTVAMGNGAAFGLPGNGEPFALMDYIGGDEISILCLTDSAIQNTHTISIYGEEAVKPEEPEQPKILLRDHTGTAVGYEMPQRLRLDTSDGGTTEFIHEDLVAEPVEKEVELDFSGGDMTVEPVDGTMFSKVTIPVPENLAPGNIAEGVSIAGIVGEMMAGGKNVKIAGGSFNGGGTVTVQHNLGVVPDLFVAWCGNSTLSGRDGSAVAIGVSRALKDRFGINYCRYAVKPSGSSAMMTDRVTTPLDEYGGDRWIYSASETKITIGSDYVTTFGYTYEWIAIGGVV